MVLQHMYRFTKPDWDTGVTPPEVTTALDAFTQPGRALDLGCGTGTNFDLLGPARLASNRVDFSPSDRTRA
jgi:hypothetical protein